MVNHRTHISAHSPQEGQSSAPSVLSVSAKSPTLSGSSFDQLLHGSQTNLILPMLQLVATEFKCANSAVQTDPLLLSNYFRPCCLTGISDLLSPTNA